MQIEAHDDPLFSRDITTDRKKKTDIHWHLKHELYYLVKGRTRYLVGERPYFLEEGNLIFVPKGVLHMTDGEDGVSRERLLISFEDNLITDEYRPLIEKLSENNLIYIPENQRKEIQALFEKIEREYDLQQSYSTQMIALYILELLIIISRLSTEATKPLLSQGNQSMYEISKYIRSNYHMELSLEVLSEHFFMNKSYLSRKFKQVFRIGINDYITYIRIFHAERLLKTTNYPITRIATECGYNDSNYFSTIFKKLKGITPYRFRSELQKSKMM